MNGRRHAVLALAALLSSGGLRNARALSLADLTEGDAAAGVRAALQQGAEVAVQLLGRADGFWGDERVRIALPEWLQRVESGLRLVGRGRDVDELRLSMNRAAEQAVPEAKALLVNTVRTMSVADAKGILTGGDGSVTRFFQERTREPLGAKFLPVVTRVTERVGLARQYNRLAGYATDFGLVKPADARIERHVTTRALDGLYFMIGEEEKKIRADPVGSGKAILRKVFGAIR
jgi:hypothetical protein